MDNIDHFQKVLVDIEYVMQICDMTRSPINQYETMVSSIQAFLNTAQYTGMIQYIDNINDMDLAFSVCYDKCKWTMHLNLASLNHSAVQFLSCSVCVRRICESYKTESLHAQ